MKLLTPPTLIDIEQAHALIRPHIEHTPLLTSGQMNHRVGAQLYFKCENFQKAGAFKSRGALHALLRLSPHELQYGVVTHSSGNHAHALARAASMIGTTAYIVMPENAPQVKVDAVKQYGGKITFCQPTLEAREQATDLIVAETSARVIHPYNDYDIIAGQATACVEMLAQGGPLDYILCPVGGGGLLSGTLLAAHYLSPESRIIGCEPLGADDAQKSFKTGQLIPSIQPKTIADGLLTSLGTLTFPIIQQFAEDIITVGEAEIVAAMRLVWERMKIIIEPSSAVPVAVALSSKFLQNKKVGIILSGGNVDLNKLPWL